ncbi:MAG TPA: sulfotransferase [Caulobacteraceae bacterium]|nr:sulfotransferase [Caulobacteraceae bacterium]
MNDIEHHLLHARRALIEGRWADLQQACAAANQIDATHWEAHYLMGMGAMNQQAYPQAEKLFARAARFAPDSATVLAMWAAALATLGQQSSAMQAAEAALRAGPADALTFDTLGVVYSRAAAYPQAASLFRKAVELEPRNTSALVNLGFSEEHLGALDAAEAAFRAAIDVDPGLAPAYFALVDLRKQTPEANLKAALTELYQASWSRPDDRLQLGHALAKTCEDLGQFEESIDWLDKAKAERRTAVAFSIEEARETFAGAAETFHAGDAQTGGFTSDEPIFIVGMPRTGTTLVDRILAAHPDVSSAEELQNFPFLVKREGRSATPKLVDADAFRRAKTINATQLGGDYVKSTRPLTGKTPRFIDKLPFNFFYAGLIHRALPEARIVCLRRDGMDTVLNNYRQMFAVGSNFHDYTTRLEDVARYFVAFDRLIAHWRRVLPANRFIEVSYETLVANQEAQTRRLLDFCGLDWNEQVLNFHENAAGVSTASSAQVRSPVYATSVGRWKRYGDKLRPAAEILAEAGLLTMA